MILYMLRSLKNPIAHHNKDIARFNCSPTTSTSTSSMIPIGKLLASIFKILFARLTKLGVDPIFKNLALASRKSTIAKSNVVNISSVVLKERIELIDLIAISSSIPDWSIFVIISPFPYFPYELFCPFPIPSLIASAYLPTLKSIIA